MNAPTPEISIPSIDTPPADYPPEQELERQRCINRGFEKAYLLLMKHYGELCEHYSEGKHKLRESDAAIREAEQRGKLAGRIESMEEAAKMLRTLFDSIAEGSFEIDGATEFHIREQFDVAARTIRARIADLRKEASK